jgi:immune inhibitor A
MKRVWLVTLFLATVVLIPPHAASVPLQPRILDKLTEYERLDAWIHLHTEAVKRGMGSLPTRGPVLTAERPKATVRVVALLVSFPDHPPLPAYTLERYQRSLFKRSGKKGGSVAALYAMLSDEALDLQGDVFGWFDLPHNLDHYAAGRAGTGDYPRNMQGLVEDAIGVSDGVSFGEYDTFAPETAGGDGVVDILVVIHSTRGTETSGNVTDLWSHSGSLPAPVEIGGVRITHYIVAPVEAPVGILAHEVARVLGAPDLSDPAYRWSGLGDWSLMGSGLWGGGGGENPALPDAYSRTHLGLTQPVDVAGELIGVDLGCGQRPPPVFRLYPGGTPGPEYFLVECRHRFRFDQRLPGEGVLVYHVDERVPDNRFFSCGPGGLHARVTVEQADGLCELEARKRAEANDLWARLEGTRFVAKDFDDFAASSSHDYEGERTGVAVRRLRTQNETFVADLFVDLPPDPERIPGVFAEVDTSAPGGAVATIYIQIPQPGQPRLLVRTMEGEVVWEGEIPLAQPGRHPYRWDPSQAGVEARGIYFVEVQTPNWWDVCRIVFP